MAATQYGFNDPSAVKLYSRVLGNEAQAATYIRKFMGESADSLIQIQDDFSKSAGDRLTITLRGQPTGDGVGGDGTLEGNEEAMSRYTDTLIIDQLRHAFRDAGKMSAQRTFFDAREEHKDLLRDWWADRWDEAFFNQISGFTPQINIYRTGNQAVQAATFINRPNGKTTDESLANTDPFTLSLIDDAVESAKSRTRDGKAVPMRPLKVGGEERWVLFISPSQAKSLRTATGENSWSAIARAGLAGGDGKKSGIFTGAIGEYNGVIIHETPRVVRGVHSTLGTPVNNTRRAVLCGAQAAVAGFGRGYSLSRYDWNEEKFDYGNQLGVEAGSIFGLKKARYGGLDFSTIVISTYNNVA